MSLVLCRVFHKDGKGVLVSTTVSSHVDAIDAGLDALLVACENPDAVTFEGLREAFEGLEKVVAKKAILDAFFAYICERDGAGSEVGSPYAAEYLKERLGLSGAEAYSRLSRGRDLYAPPPPPPPPSDDAGEETGFDFDLGGSDEDDAAERQRRARENAKRLNDEKMRIIDRALKDLMACAQCERAEILEKATEQAQLRTPEDLRKYVNRLVANANRRHKAADPNAAWDQRGVIVKDDESTGICDIHIRTTSGYGALMLALLNHGLPANSNLPNKDELDAAGARDYRSPAQRRHDELINILENWDKHKTTQRQGAASLVLAITMDDLADADHTTKFLTNTGISLDATELVRLGIGGAEDFVLQLDRVTGLPISLGRTRLASVHQRIALLALQGVCAWEGCTKPMGELEIHHIIAHAQGGDTHLHNLIGVCRTHHRANNDARDGRGNRRHLERDPVTGEVGVQHRPGTKPHVNMTQGHTDSPGYKLRHRERKAPVGSPGDPPMFPFGPDGPPF